LTIVIDASVAAKWLIAEPDSDAANALLIEDLIAPSIFLNECANVLWKRIKSGEISSAEGVELFDSLTTGEIILYEVAPAEAFALAIELNHPVYDCLYLALARARNVQVVTADRRFVKAAVDAGYGAHIRLLGDRQL